MNEKDTAILTAFTQHILWNNAYGLKEFFNDRRKANNKTEKEQRTEETRRRQKEFLEAIHNLQMFLVSQK